MKVQKLTSTLTEGNNTNLRRFLLSAAAAAGIDVLSALGAATTRQVVVHHIKKDHNSNGVDELVLMHDRDHRSMHNKYKKKWNENSYTEHKHILVRDIISKLAEKFKDQAVADERELVEV